MSYTTPHQYTTGWVTSRCMKVCAKFVHADAGRKGTSEKRSLSRIGGRSIGRIRIGQGREACELDEETVPSQSHSAVGALLATELMRGQAMSQTVSLCL